MSILRTGIILSGGQSSRLGRDKGLVELEGCSLILRVIDKLQNVVDEIIVVVGSDKMIPKYSAAVPENVHVISDFYKEDAPLIGLISGLMKARGEYAVVCACDMPFIEPKILDILFRYAIGMNGVLILKQDGWIEPIPSVYHVYKCLKKAEELRKNGEFRIRKVLESMNNIVLLPIEKLRELDPDLISFIDLDTTDSLEVAKKIIMKADGHGRIGELR
jgi:molybdopterin-guanine dinucleotide biosynthesis protein A